jgi:hypothetical protein
MWSIFRALLDRLKALFATRAVLELEAECLARDAERQAELLRLAARYDAEGLHDLARSLHQQAETLNMQQPLASVLPAVAHLHQRADVVLDTPHLFVPDGGTGPNPLPSLQTTRPSRTVTSPPRKGTKS